MGDHSSGSDTPGAGDAHGQDISLTTRIRRLIVGPPRRIDDHSLSHKLTLVALLAWVGLGADGLSSSAYGPEEAFRTLGSHTYLAIALALVMAATVAIISIAYSRVIEHFPGGGGGYVVASRLLGPKAGLVSGSALLVDYVLTITISIAAAGDALFSFLPPEWASARLPVEGVLIVVLIALNLRGVRESTLVLAPIFGLFVLTHAVLIGVGIFVQHGHLGAVASHAASDFRQGLHTLGAGALLLLFIHAYSLGGGTYTGIEAVSNGLSIMRAPQVRTGKRTMMYMALSLAFTASGLLLCYLIWGVSPVEGKTMNAALAEKFIQVVPLGKAFVVLTMLSEGTILVVAAQAGFVDGPRVLANMAVDSWMPRRFAALSERLTAQNGVLLMGGAALAALLLTHGDVRYLVVMYSINVFLTFSMTELSMCRLWISERAHRKDWSRKIVIHVIGLAMCSTILTITVIEKFTEGGWITLLITLAVITMGALIRHHYERVTKALTRAFQSLTKTGPASNSPLGPVPPEQPVAVLLVSDFNGLGVHTTLNVFRVFPGQFKGIIFATVGVIDSGEFKGEGTVARLQSRTSESLSRYASVAHTLGVPCDFRSALGTDAVDEAARLCTTIAREFPRAVFFAGQVVFPRENWLQRLLHNQTAFAIQRRLQLIGANMVILPAKVATE